jgi:membrane protein
MPLSRWKAVLLDAYHAMTRHRLVAVAAGVVFYALLAVFPAITAFVSVYGLFADSATVADHLSLLANVLPGGALDIVREQVGRITAKPTELGFAFAFGTALALWSANAGVKAMIDALNVVEEQEERRGFIMLNLASLTFTLGAIVFLLLAVGAVVAFPLIMSAFGLEQVAGTATWLLRWPVLLALSLGAFAVLYRFGPSRNDARRCWITPGTLFAALAWIAGSAALSLYLSKFADYNATYGSLGAAIGLMMWMWLSSVVVLAGAQLDCSIRRILRRDA